MKKKVYTEYMLFCGHLGGDICWCLVGEKYSNDGKRFPLDILGFNSDSICVLM